MMTLLLHLQARGRASGKDLARLLEVSERTVQRDVEALVAAGIPVRSMRGPAGGYRLDGGYRTRLTGVGLDEAGALPYSAWPDQPNSSASVSCWKAPASRSGRV
jgi:predicted DNA-binding transcriptional regulator YafY